MSKTNAIMASLAEVFQAEAQKQGTNLQAVPAATVFDTGVIRDIVREELSKLPPPETQTVETVLTVQAPDGIHKLEGVQHEKFPEVLAVVSAGEPVYLHGPAGTGKSHIAEQAAKALGLDFYMCNCITQEFKLTGFVDAGGNFVETSFYKAFKNGGVFFIDELDGSTPEALININTALANGYFDFPGIGRVDAHENFRCIAAGNTTGTGADENYTGRYQLDASSLDRFYFVHIDYSKQIEKAMAGGDMQLVDFAHDFRKAVHQLNLQTLFTYRAIKRIATLKSVIPLEDVLTGALLKGLEHSDLMMLDAVLSVSGMYRSAFTTVANYR